MTVTQRVLAAKKGVVSCITARESRASGGEKCSDMFSRMIVRKYSDGDALVILEQ